MAILQMAQVFAAIALLCFAVTATGYSARRLLTQDQAHPLPQTVVETLWLVTTSLWVAWILVYWSLKW